MLPAYVERYVTNENRGFLEDVYGYLPHFTFDEAKRFYRWLEERARGSKVEIETEAALGLIDRYYLLAVLCGRKKLLVDGQTDYGREWIYDRCREVERDPDGFLDLWAREHMKSTLITFGGGIQEILRDPEITIGIFAANNKVAKPFLTQIKREFQDNEVLKARYPDVLWGNPQKEAPTWSVQEGILVKRQSNPKELTVEAHGLIDGMPTGRHFSLRIYDDVVTKEMVTDQMIPKVTEARELSDNLSGGDGREWNVGTRYSFADTYGILIERGALKERRYPATKDGKKDGQPVLFSQEKWDEKKIKQPSQIAAQMLQNPAAGEESTFDPIWLKSAVIRPRTLNIYILVDPSKGPKSGKRSDRTGMPVIAVDSAENLYLVDGYRHRMNLDERWRLLKGLHKKWSNVKGVQNVQVGYERYGLQSDIEHYEFRMRQEKYVFAIDEVSWPREGAGSKIDRVERLVPDFARGRFRLCGLVHHEVHGTCTWRFDDDVNKIVYAPLKGELREQRLMREQGESDRALMPIKRRDESGQVYDLTRVFIEEYLFFPFGAHDDLIDATDRVHDLEPVPPIIYETMDLQPEIFEDGV